LLLYSVEIIITAPVSSQVKPAKTLHVLPLVALFLQLDDLPRLQ
jgi:hypothetical protein